MINVKLPDDFEQDSEIKEIFTNLAIDIEKKLSKEVKIFYSKDKAKAVEVSKNRSTILQFLLAKDFYNYSFEVNAPNQQNGKITQEEVKAWLSIPSNCHFKSLSSQSKGGGSAICKEFYQDYHGKNYYNDLVKCKEKNGKTTKEKKLNNLIAIFPQIKSLLEAFKYENLNAENRYLILEKMDINVCPYCNMNYIISYKMGESKLKKATADIDHFYLQSIYPFYALCLYNFVPSCQICNSRIRGKKHVECGTHLHPLFEGTDKETRFFLENLERLYIDVDSEEAIIKVKNITEGSKAEKSMELFHIEERYQEMGWKAKELLTKAIKYNACYTDELNSMINGRDNNLINIQQLVFGTEFSEVEVKNRSLGKLKNDLLNQFGIYK